MTPDQLAEAYPPHDDVRAMYESDDEMHQAFAYTAGAEAERTRQRQAAQRRAEVLYAARPPLTTAEAEGLRWEQAYWTATGQEYVWGEGI